MPSLKETAAKNPTQIGDPVSLKAETSNTEPTENDRPAKASSSSSSGKAAKDSSNPQNSYASSSAPVMAPAPTEQDIDSSDSKSSESKAEGGDETLKERAQKKLDAGNATQLGDPVSLKAETSDSEPTEDDRGVRGTTKAGKLDSKL